MRAFPRLLAFLLLLCALWGLASLPVGAEEERDWLGEFLDALPPALREPLPAEVTPETAGEMVGFSYLAQLALDSLRGEMPAVLSLFGKLLGYTLLAAGFGLLARTLQGEEVRPLLQTVLRILTAVAVWQQMQGWIVRVEQYLADVGTLVNALAPPLLGLLVAGGNSALAGTGSGAFAAFLWLGETLCSSLLTPLSLFSFAFTLLACCMQSSAAKSVGHALRNCYLTVLGLAATLFAASLTFQGILASSADTVAVRTAKYVVGNLIPVVGSAVSGSVGTLAASLGLMRRTLGIAAVAVLLLIALPPILGLLLVRLALQMAGAVSEMLGGDGACVFTEFRSICDMLLAVTVFSSVLLILYVAVFLTASTAWGG